MFPMPLYCHRAGLSVENVDWLLSTLTMLPRPKEETIKRRGDEKDDGVKQQTDGVHTGVFFFLEFIRLYDIFCL